MLQKLGMKDGQGKDLYQHVTMIKDSSGFKRVFGEVGTLAYLNTVRAGKPKETTEKEKH